MSVKNRVKKLFSSAKKVVTQDKRSKKLIKWQKRLEAAKGGQDLALMDKREYLYLGDRKVDKNVNATTSPSKRSNNVYNIIYEFVETGVSSQIPMPQVKSKREGFEVQANMIADSIANDLKESDIDEINDKNERITPVQGFSIVEVCWNPDIKHHLYRGEIELKGRHPKQLVTQPKVYGLQKMDYFFILSDVTHDYVQRRYGKNMDGEEEQYPENTRLFDTDQPAAGGVVQRSASDSEEEPLTEIVCWYTDDNGEKGKFVWINDTELEDLPQYYYRRVDGQIVEDETLEEDVLDGDGQVIAKAGETVPYFIPNMYPVSIRINIPRNFAFGGQSDVDVIRDQQDSIKRVVHKMEEKIVKGGTIIKALDDHSSFDKITDEIYQIIKGSQGELQALGTMDLTADITKDLQFVQEQYRMAQSMLGVTNSFQGKEDPTATSGKAKQIQVQQASGRMQSKQFNKFVHYKELFQIIFEFKLSMYDEIRPYLAQDQKGNDVFGEFDKYKFLQRDKAGQLYYNTDFIFGTDGSLGLPKDPMFMYQQSLALFQAQAIDATQLWSILESLQFPQASKIKKQIEEKMDLEAQMMQMQQQYEQKIAADQEEINVLNEQVNQLTDHVNKSGQSNEQGDLDTQSKEQEAEQRAEDQRLKSEQQTHSQDMDFMKIDLEHKKLEANKEKQAVGAGAKNSKS